MTVISLMRHRTDPERVEAYTQWSLIGSFLIVPLLGLSVVSTMDGSWESRLPWTVAYLVALVLQGALGALLSALGIRQLREGVTVSRTLVVLTCVMSLSTGALALGFDTAPGLGGRAGGVALAFAVGLMALGTALPIRTLLLLCVGAAAGVAAVAGFSLPEVSDPQGRHLQPVPAFIATGIAAAAIASSFRFSVWLLGVVWELDRTRTAHARLAVAEERLRFSRDLHDVVGRALSAVAVKSELAAALAERGQEGAAEQMGEVRELAQETLKEMRGVVAGYRSADLEAEFDGARSVLRSAGTDVEIVGAEHVRELPRTVQEGLAWVVREAVTNVVRHSAATRCEIALATGQPGAVRLSITNDGVGAAPRARGGSGLPGLRERLAPLGGDLETTLEGDVHTLTALIPLDASQAGQDDQVGRASLERDPS